MFSDPIYLKCFACRFFKYSNLLYNVKINHNVHNDVVFIYQKVAAYICSLFSNKSGGGRNVCSVASLILLHFFRREVADVHRLKKSSGKQIDCGIRANINQYLIEKESKFKVSCYSFYNLPRVIGIS